MCRHDSKHYGSSYSLAYLRELAQTSREGTSALGLVEVQVLGKLVFVRI